MRQGHPGAGRGDDSARNQLDALTDQAKRWGAKGLVWMRVEASEGGGALVESPVAKFLTERRAGRRWSPRSRPTPATSC